MKTPFLKIKENESSEEYGIIGNVYYKYYIHDINLPLVITFAHLGEVTSTTDISNSNYTPWAYNFIKKQNLNVLSFSTYKTPNWYRGKTFHNFIKKLALELVVFKEKLGYGSSMGGYAVSAFADTLGLDRILILNPISTLNRSLVPWETRFRIAATKYPWDTLFHDAALSSCDGHIVYDPLFHCDYQHAQRYKHLVHIKFPGVGHSTASHLQRLKILQPLFDSFIKNTINKHKLNKLLRKRRNYLGYYDWLLSDKNIHLTPKRKVIIEKYRNILLIKKYKYKVISQTQIKSLKKILLRLESKNPTMAKKISAIMEKIENANSYTC